MKPNLLKIDIVLDLVKMISCRLTYLSKISIRISMWSCWTTWTSFDCKAGQLNDYMGGNKIHLPATRKIRSTCQIFLRLHQPQRLVPDCNPWNIMRWTQWIKTPSSLPVAPTRSRSTGLRRCLRLCQKTAWRPLVPDSGVGSRPWLMLMVASFNELSFDYYNLDATLQFFPMNWFLA